MKKKIILILSFVLILAIVVFFYVFRSLPDNQNEITTDKIENADGSIYSISTSSEALFMINEQLAGKPFTAIGKTNQISGEISVSESNKKLAVKVGTIKIDANSFKTDSKQRDSAIRKYILKSTQAGNEYIEFKTKSITGLPENISSTSSFSILIAGDMTISGVTKLETFNAKVDIIDSENIKVNITGKIRRSDFGLVIPQIPFVANVSDEFTLEGDIRARLMK